MINLSIDKSVCKDLRDLAELQKTDPRIQKIRGKIAQQPTVSDPRYWLVDDTLLYREAGHGSEWKPVLPACLEERAIQYTHTSLGHLGVEKCMQQIKQAYHLKNLGHKMRKFIACCDTCQRVKFLNRAITTGERSHLMSKPGSLCATDIFGSLPTSCGGVKYVLVCYDVFSKHIKLYPLKAATTRACLNKLINHYFLHVIKPEVILSDNGIQFHSPSWKQNLESLYVQVRYTAVRHPQTNPSERCMKEISEFFRIYCSNNHRKLAELISHIELRLNNTVASATGFTPAELMFGDKGPNIFEDFLPEAPEGEPVLEDLVKNRQGLREDDKENRGQKEKQKEVQSTLET